MRKLLLLTLLAVAGCRNDAITYAHAIMPGCTCAALKTSVLSGVADTAVCRYGKEIWKCVVTDSTPDCTKIRDLPAELPGLSR